MHVDLTNEPLFLFTWGAQVKFVIEWLNPGHAVALKFSSIVYPSNGIRISNPFYLQHIARTSVSWLPPRLSPDHDIPF
jgi:hypothetical protein